jgi:long-chain acyl-CoA synthetase
MYPSLPAMHRTISERLRAQTAVKYKESGRYRDLSWSEYRRQADAAAAGLIELGVRPGNRVAILSANRFEWLVADHAVLSCAAIDVPLHAPLSPKQVEYQVSHSESQGIIVSGPTQAAKVHEVVDALPELEFIVSFEPIEPLGRLRTLSWDQLQQLGVEAGADALAEIHRREGELSGTDLATIIYTSGTTGNPKGVMLTHANLLSNSEATLRTSKVSDDDFMLSWLPYSHIYARTVDHYLSTLAEMTLCLSESIDSLRENLQEIHPTWMTSVPRFYEKVWSDVEQLAADERRDELWQIFGPRIRQLSSGGAPLPRHVCEGFHEAGLPLLEGYGLTESSPVISFNSLENCRIGTVGRAIPDVDVRIADDGEILTRGPHVMKGYWKNPEATAATIIDGWLQTGDIGVLDDEGYLSITDRKKDLIITSGGKNIAPTELERLLVSDPYIDQAVIYGDARPFVTAIIVPSQDNLNRKAAQLSCPLDIREEFVRNDRILDFFQQRVDALMQAVSGPERVKKFLLLGRLLTLEADELTATLKVRRRHVIQKYESALAALYER